MTDRITVRACHLRQMRGNIYARLIEARAEIRRMQNQIDDLKEECERLRESIAIRDEDLHAGEIVEFPPSEDGSLDAVAPGTAAEDLWDDWPLDL